MGEIRAPLEVLRRSRRPRPLKRALSIVRAESASLRQGFLANLISSGGDLIAGIVLGSITGMLESIPGLLVLIPAAIGMRGNIFGALGSRLGTALHMGQLGKRFTMGGVLGENIYASTVLSLVISLAMAFIARIVALAFGAPSVRVIDLVVISVVGGVLSSVFVLVIAIAVAVVSARRNWDLDYVSAPLVTAAGDMVTLPALVVATLLIGIPYFTSIVGISLALVALGSLIFALRQAPKASVRIILESLPVLLIAAAVDSVAGLTIEKRLADFVALPALLVMLPPFLENSGSLGSMLSARISSKLHVGLISPRVFPTEALPDAFLLYLLAIPVYLFTGIASHVGAVVIGVASPGIWPMISISLMAGAMATTAGMLIAYYGAVGTFRWGFDPDNHGVPLVTSSMDVIAAVAVIVTIVFLGYSSA